MSRESTVDKNQSIVELIARIRELEAKLGWYSERGKAGGRKGGKATAKSMTAAERKERASNAAKHRWKKINNLRLAKSVKHR